MAPKINTEYVSVVKHEVVGVVGEGVAIPCNCTPGYAHTGDRPALILWYKDKAKLPIYRSVYFIITIHFINSRLKLSYYHYCGLCFTSFFGHFPFGWWVSSLTFKVHGLDTAKMLIFVLLSPLQLNKWVYKHDKDIKYVESVLLEYKCRFLQSSF